MPKKKINYEELEEKILKNMKNIQLKVDEELHRKLRVYQASNSIPTLPATIEHILNSQLNFKIENVTDMLKEFQMKKK